MRIFLFTVLLTLSSVVAAHKDGGIDHLILHEELSNMRALYLRCIFLNGEDKCDRFVARFEKYLSGLGISDSEQMRLIQHIFKKPLEK